MGDVFTEEVRRGRVWKIHYMKIVRLQNLQDFAEQFLFAAYSEKNDNPVLVFEKSTEGDREFIYQNDFFLFKSVASGVHHEIEHDILYFKKFIPPAIEMVPIWFLSSRCQVLLPEHRELIYKFRRTAYHTRMHQQNILPIKGPKECKVGMIEYENISATDWDTITARSETILINKKPAFTGRYDGGFLIPVEMLDTLVALPVKKPHKVLSVEAPHEKVPVPAVNVG